MTHDEDPKSSPPPSGRLRGSIPANLLLMIVSFLVAIVIAEVALTLFLSRDPVQASAARAGNAHDRRTRAAVIQDLRDDGVEAFPDLHGRTLVRNRGNVAHSPIFVTPENDSIIPLAPSIARAEVVLCNESGPWIRYRADEHGYRNPQGAWDQKPIDLVLIGDSYTLGLCHADDGTIAGRLHNGWPAMLNLGLPGAGPLLELGILKEYAADLEPSVVLWLYYEGNDLSDLDEERHFNGLRRYLEKGYQQGLRKMQSDIDDHLGEYLENQLVEATAHELAPGRRRLRSLLTMAAKLTHLRSFVGLVRSYEPPMEALEELHLVLEEARSTVSAWDGQLVFVHLPTYNRWAQRDATDAFMATGAVHRILAELEIPLIDVTRSFDDQPYPRSLFAYPGAHYTREGNAIAARTISEQLETLVAH
jgi:hypothetical protein